ncbi:unnamed protein product [Cylicocyclus nassatus]|uniref:Uncharacterized protein n=1 Tax=Cylicocyclus nassatus TaxID=53992 RepID=A0AA36HCY2_CYLNA|nr:unnamed protein product [Cylicocyclus nassatus]
MASSSLTSSILTLLIYLYCLNSLLFMLAHISYGMNWWQQTNVFGSNIYVACITAVAGVVSGITAIYALKAVVPHCSDGEEDTPEIALRRSCMASFLSSFSCFMLMFLAMDYIDLASEENFSLRDNLSSVWVIICAWLMTNAVFVVVVWLFKYVKQSKLTSNGPEKMPYHSQIEHPVLKVVLKKSVEKNPPYWL